LAKAIDQERKIQGRERMKLKLIEKIRFKTFIDENGNKSKKDYGETYLAEEKTGKRITNLIIKSIGIIIPDYSEVKKSTKQKRKHKTSLIEIDLSCLSKSFKVERK
jgi:hypothetical protein